MPTKGIPHKKIVLIVAFVGLLLLGGVFLYLIWPVGYNSGDNNPPLAGSLTYKGNSTPANGSVTFQLSLASSINPLLSDVTVRALDSQGNFINATANWIHISSDTNHIKSGDELIINKSNTNIQGYEILLHVEGYSGTISGKVPISRLGGE